MLGATRITRQESTPYAIPSDFCRIFQQDMNRLYLLSYLLTGDHDQAERCFVRGLEDSGKGSPVFKEWARSWARRIIIRNAIQMVRPRSTERTSVLASGRSLFRASEEQAEIAEILELPTFERFVFVTSVLEGYSDRECSLLLDCSRAEVQTARVYALEKIGKSAHLSRGLVEGVSKEGTAGGAPEPVFQVISSLAASA